MEDCRRGFPIYIKGFEFFAMAGPAYMQSTISKGVSASDSGLGYILGAVSYYDVRSFGLPAWMNGGA